MQSFDYTDETVADTQQAGNEINIIAQVTHSPGS